MNASPCLAPRRLLLVACTWALAFGSARADEPPAAPAPVPSPVLHLADGGFASGSLAASDRPGVILWQTDGFTTPLEFPIDVAASIHYPVAGGEHRPAPGALGFELTGGDTLYGSLISLDDKTAELDVARLGRVRLDRSRLARIFRWRNGGDLIYDGPNGLSGWRDIPSIKTLRPSAVNPGPVGVGIVQGLFQIAAPARPFAPPGPPGPLAPPAWREEMGQLVATQPGAILQGEMPLPARASIDLELSWTQTPNFTIAFGTTDASTVGLAFRLETWDGQLVLVRETDTEADLAAIRPIPSGAGRIHLRGFLDQTAGRFLLVAEDGQTRAELKIGGPAGTVRDGIRLINHQGDLRLERLRISRWDGETASIADAAAGARVELADGSTTRKTVDRFDADKHEFILRDDAGESRVAEDQVVDLRLTPPADTAARAIHALYQDGTRISGDWSSVEAATLVLAVPGVAAPIRLPLDGMRALEVPRRDRKPVAKGDLTGTLELDGLSLPGRLADTTGQEPGTALSWQPLGANAACVIRPGASGRIFYRNAPAAAGMTQVNTNQARRINVPADFVVAAPVVLAPAIRVDNVVIQGRPAVAARAVAPVVAPAPPVDAVQMKNVVVRAQPADAVRVVAPAVAPAQAPLAVQGVIQFSTSTTSPNRGQPQPTRRSLYLRTGDIIPCEVEKIDETGVTFRTELSKNTFVPNDRVKAVVLASETGPVMQIGKVRRERLLTLPRMQKGSPPTHLVRSKTGDVLRGRIVAMDKDTVRVEVRMEERPVPRDRVSRIIWFHADETDPSKKPAEPAEAAPALRVQVVRDDGIRLTFVADKVANGTLIGRSEVLGPCEVPLKDVDQLLIGGAVEKEATQLAYQQWKLQDAPEPKSALADGGGAGGADAGTESALVGKPAPDFTLDLLSGGKFHLAEARGEVILLDFWATWCGPCLQAMPQIDRVAHEFEGKGVRLVAVNLQEPPAKIKALLERIKLSPTVALDRNGLVAEQYEANAIPQTVIIDREGKIARLFVGGGPHFDDQLREALKALVPDPKP